MRIVLTIPAGYTGTIHVRYHAPGYCARLRYLRRQPAGVIGCGAFVRRKRRTLPLCKRGHYPCQTASTTAGNGKGPAHTGRCPPEAADAAAPCSSATLERLSAHFDLTILTTILNIYPPEEYHRREAELERFVEEAGYHYPVVELPYDPQEFYTAVKGLETSRRRAHAARSAIGCGWSRLPAMPPRTALTGTARRFHLAHEGPHPPERAWHRAGQAVRRAVFAQ